MSRCAQNLGMGNCSEVHSYWKVPQIMGGGDEREDVNGRFIVVCMLLGSPWINRNILLML
jgi:hypothetical protein